MLSSQKWGVLGPRLRRPCYIPERKKIEEERKTPVHVAMPDKRGKSHAGSSLLFFVCGSVLQTGWLSLHFRSKYSRLPITRTSKGNWKSFELSRVKLYRKWSQKGNENWFELARVRVIGSRLYVAREENAPLPSPPGRAHETFTCL